MRASHRVASERQNLVDCFFDAVAGAEIVAEIDDAITNIEVGINGVMSSNKLLCVAVDR